MPVIHRKTLAVWSFRANIENLTQRLSVSLLVFKAAEYVSPASAWEAGLNVTKHHIIKSI